MAGISLVTWYPLSHALPMASRPPRQVTMSVTYDVAGLVSKDAVDTHRPSGAGVDVAELVGATEAPSEGVMAGGLSLGLGDGAVVGDARGGVVAVPHATSRTAAPSPGITCRMPAL